MTNWNRTCGVALLLILAGSNAGCSASKRSKYSVKSRSAAVVSVETDGRAVSNFEQQLVHRIDLRPDAIERLRAPNPRLYDLLPERDREGNFRGLRVVHVLDIRNSLQLQIDDIVTAVNKVQTNSADAFYREFVRGLEGEYVSVTFDRATYPHKALYYTVHK